MTKHYANHSGTIYVGLSSVNYENNTCAYGERGSATYANAFMTGLNSTTGSNSKSKLFDRRELNATKSDFLSETSSTNINNVDFMVFIGHGFNNKLHFIKGPDGTLHSSDKDNHNISSLNFSHTEAEFGSGTARTKWGFAFTCNFLTTTSDNSTYSTTLTDLYKMMEGAHIVLGAGSQLYLNKYMIEAFGENLSSGQSIIDAYFNTAEIQAEYSPITQKYKVIYALRAIDDTIYNYATGVKGYSEGETFKSKSQIIEPAS